MNKKPNGFEKPNHTQTPNSFFDEIMKDIDTMAELKVTLAIIRQTIGWHRKRTRFGVGKIERLTGLARNSVISGAETAENRGTIQRIETTGEAEWELVIQNTPSTVEGAEFEGDATDEGDPPQDLTQNPSTVEGHKRKKENKKEIKDRATPKANTYPELVTFREVTKRYPNEVNWQDIIDSFLKINLRLGRDATKDDLIPFYKFWTGKGYNPFGLGWLEWAVKGETPKNAKEANIQEPKAFDGIRKFLARHQGDSNG